MFALRLLFVLLLVLQVAFVELTDGCIEDLVWCVACCFGVVC